MDEIAERGFAAHWKYKGISNHNHFDPWLDSIREILEDKEKDAIEFINDFKNNLFSEEVFVYTPAGEVKVLPKGATALDFAFSIHTDIGYHRSEEHTSELQSRGHLVCRLLLEKKKNKKRSTKNVHTTT